MRIGLEEVTDTREPSYTRKGPGRTAIVGRRKPPLAPSHEDILRRSFINSMTNWQRSQWARRRGKRRGYSQDLKVIQGYLAKKRAA